MNINELNDQTKEFIAKADNLNLKTPVLAKGGDFASWIQKSIIGNVHGGYKMPAQMTYTGPNIPFSILKHCQVNYKDTREHEVLFFDNKLKIIHQDKSGLRDPNKPDVMRPYIKKSKIHQYECALTLDRYITNNFELTQWEETVNKMILTKFADLENEMIISNDGIVDSVQGIGDLEKHNSKVAKIEIDLNDSKTWIKLHDTLIDLKTHMNYEQQSGLVLCTSPKILSVLRRTRDLNGQLLSKSFDSLFTNVFVNEKFDSVKNQIVIGNFAEYLVIKQGDYDVVKDDSTDRTKVTQFIISGLTTMILSPMAFSGIAINFK